MFKNLSQEQLLSLLGTCGSTLKTLDLTGLAIVVDEILPSVSAAAPNLETLGIYGCPASYAAARKAFASMKIQYLHHAQPYTSFFTTDSSSRSVSHGR